MAHERFKHDAVQPVEQLTAIEQEVLWHLDSQAWQQETLGESGTLGKALAALDEHDASKRKMGQKLLNPPSDAYMDSPLAKVGVYKQVFHAGTAEEYERLSLHFSLTEHSGRGSRNSHPRTVPVAMRKDGVTWPVGSFSFDDAEVVESIARGLEFSREAGILPHLSDDLYSINRPDYTMAKLPPITQSQRLPIHRWEPSK